MNETALTVLNETMRRQTALFEIVLAEEGSMRDSIRSRDWEALSRSLKAVEALEAEIQALEDRRMEVFRVLLAEEGLAPDSSFYVWAVTLPPVDRDAIVPRPQVPRPRSEGLGHGDRALPHGNEAAPRFHNGRALPPEARAHLRPQGGAQGAGDAFGRPGPLAVRGKG